MRRLASTLLAAVALVGMHTPVAHAKCRTKACWKRVHDARADAWLKRERPAVWFWRREPAAWRSWARATAFCESGNRPHIATGNGFYGWLQFVPSTWYSAQRLAPPVLRTRLLPHRLRAEHQGVVAIRFAKVHGRGHWPVCGR